MSLIGHISEFVEGTSIHDYLDQFTFYFEANSIDDDKKKRGILVIVIGQKQFWLLKDLCQPNSPGQKSFGRLSDMLKDFHTPPPPKFLQRVEFD